MKSLISKKLAIATFIVCILYVCVFTFYRIDLVQKQNGGNLNGEANAAFTCPSGYVEVADFCIQSKITGTETWYNASKLCTEDESARLCRSNELMAACQAESNGTSFDDAIDGPDWEWADDMAIQNEAVVLFDNSNGCKSMDRKNILTSSNDFRCCVNRY